MTELAGDGLSDPKALTAEAPHEGESPKKLQMSELFSAMYEGYGINATEQTKLAAVKNIGKYLKQSISDNPSFELYNIIVLYDKTTMTKSDADNVYNSVTTFQDKKPILLVLQSNGGDVGTAYLIGKLCREYSSRFIVAVPRQAKSAATLLCCAADEIHMGSLSELGPIDPQINRLPALGLKNSIEHIAQLVKGTPESAEMFAKYLFHSLKPIDLGYYERVAESASQYAERLLKIHSMNLPKNAAKIAYDLVYTYKDHGFVIDKGEATNIFGDKIVKTNTNEYLLGNSLYKALDTVENIADLLGYSFYFIGSLDSEPFLRKRS